MALTFRLQQILTADEAAFAENAESGTPGWDLNLPFLEGSATLSQERLVNETHLARLADKLPGEIGARTGEITFKTYYGGHQTTAAGALTETWQMLLLYNGLGGEDVAGDGGTAAAGGSASSVNTTAVTAIAAGGAIRIGEKGDGKGDGQLYPVSAFAANTATLLVEAVSAPQASDVIFAVGTVHHSEGASLVSRRFLVLNATTGAQFLLVGGQLSALKFSLAPGAIPTIEWTYRCAYWRRMATTFPNTTALSAHSAAPMAGGSLFINDVGTATRATIDAAEVELSYDLGLEPVLSPAGGGTYQFINGWARTGVSASLSVKIPWVTAYETWWDSPNNSITYKHIMLTCNPTDGRSVGFYMPRVAPMRQRPSAVTEVNGQNYVTVDFQAREGATTTTELTRSAVRFFFA